MSNPKLEVLTPQNSQLIVIDHQPQMAFGVQSIDRQTLKNNVVALAKAAKAFNIPTTITTVESQSFSGYSYPELLDVFPDKAVLERTSMNSWDDQKVRDALKANKRNKVIVAGLWTEVCNNTFAALARPTTLFFSVWRSIDWTPNAICGWWSMKMTCEFCGVRTSSFGLVMRNLF